MGAAGSRQTKNPQSIEEFRGFSEPSDALVIPEVPQKRQVTNFKFTVIFGIFILVLIPFAIYSFTQSELDRFTRGYDDCGNVCGKNNTAFAGIPCSGKDETNYPYLLMKQVEGATVGPPNSVEDILREKDRLASRECVTECPPNYIVEYNRCVEDNDPEARHLLEEIGRDINRSSGRIVAICFVGLALCIGMLLLFRYFVAVVVWVILWGSILVIVALTGLFWYLNSQAKNQQDKDGFLYIAVIFTIVSIILVILLLCMIKRVKLIIRLFKESIKIIFGMPIILFEPLLTLLAHTILCILGVFFVIVWLTAGSLEYIGQRANAPEKSVYEYMPGGVILFTIALHGIICLWMYQFIAGCQQMVISGAVSAFYFARDKSSLTAPIYNSFYNLIRYHLGTVAFGSLIITIVALIKGIIRSLANNKQTKLLVDCCLGMIEEFLKYLSKNAYIQTAMHGQPFLKSGKRAVRLLVANAIDVIAVNSVGDFVLFMAKTFIVALTIVFGIVIADKDVPQYWAAVLIGAFVTALLADAFFGVFETAVDTIFLCFCEDNTMNDGMTRPYYMTTDLMQYMEEAKKTVKAKN